MKLATENKIKLPIVYGFNKKVIQIIKSNIGIKYHITINFTK